MNLDSARAYFFAKFLLIANCVFLVIISSRSGIGLSWDSTDYIAVGKSMAERTGLLDVMGNPMTIRPPGISFLVSLGDLLGLSASNTFLLINSVSAGLSAFFFVLILEKLNVRKTFIIGGLAVISYSPTLLNVNSMAWSEPVFIALVMCAIWIALFPRSISKEIFLGLLFVLMFFVRYVGPFYAFPIAVTAIYSQMKASGFLRASVRGGLVFLVSLIPQYLWLIRNESIDGTLTGARVGAGGNYLEPVKTLVGTFGSWVVGHEPLNGNAGLSLNWGDHSPAMKTMGILFLLLFTVLSFFVYWFRLEGREKARMFFALLMISMFYIVFSVYRYVNLEVGPLDGRMMSGIYLLLIISVCIGLDLLIFYRLLKVFCLFVFVALLISMSGQSITAALRFGTEGRHWASKVHTEQPLHQFVKQLPKDSQFMSNEPQMLYSIVEEGPIFNQFMNAQIFPKECSQRYFVWYNTSYLPDVKPVNGNVIYSDLVGEVIHLADCSTPASLFWP